MPRGIAVTFLELFLSIQKRVSVVDPQHSLNSPHKFRHVPHPQNDDVGWKTISIRDDTFSNYLIPALASYFQVFCNQEDKEHCSIFKRTEISWSLFSSPIAFYMGFLWKGLIINISLIVALAGEEELSTWSWSLLRYFDEFCVVLRLLQWLNNKVSECVIEKCCNHFIQCWQLHYKMQLIAFVK